jgi:hypothetical protein
VIEPRKAHVVEVVHVVSKGGSTPVSKRPGTRSSTGVREHGIRLRGFLQEPGRSCHFRRRKCRCGSRLTKDPGLRLGDVHRRQERNPADAQAVRLEQGQPSPVGRMVGSQRAE